MKKEAIYTELPIKVVTDTKRIALRLGVPMNKIVELALREFVDNDPQIELKLTNANTRKK